MTLANVLLGMAIGFPMMIAVGPISVLLLDQGLQRGIRAAAPAAFGVASADLSLSIVASVAGTTVSAVLAPISTWLTIAAVAVLAWLAVDLARSALGGLRAAPPTAVLPAVVPPTEVPAVEVPHERRSMVGVGRGAPIADRRGHLRRTGPTLQRVLVPVARRMPGSARSVLAARRSVTSPAPGWPLRSTA